MRRHGLRSLLSLLVPMLMACGGSAANHPAAPVIGSGGGDLASGNLDVGPVASQLGDDLGFFGNGLTFIDHGSFGLDRAGVLANKDPKLGQVLRVSYPSGSASKLSAADDGTTYGGTQAYLQLPDGPVDDLHLRYYVAFQPGFNFVKGGKLPGLYGGTVNNGRKIPNGTNGWSSRYMWRTDGAGEVYAYLPSSVAHGTSLGRGSWNFLPGQWTCIEQAVHLNTPGKSDGSVTVWVNGTEVFQQTGMVYRTVSSLRIEGLFFSTFFGGGDASWASPTDQFSEFAAFAVSPNYIGPIQGVATGS